MKGMADAQVHAKLRDLRSTTLKDTLEEACMLQDNQETETQKARFA